ncbi:Acetylglutamate kinase [Methanosarcinaceae archaeon Ag5]|uniref:Isopentenyl phosphate kinase n=1 Tax=Methanolapillus africanus TaxID=3028297 RepID=A0AAE4SEI8_9EURY|nr:Acetylglutamate kinase [Methanosarcinaceae archaeon Ag5]
MTQTSKKSTVDGITVLKIGGSAVTDKNATAGLAKEDEMRRIFKEIASFSGPLVIVHGAGSYGHTHAKEYGLDKGFHKEGFLITHDSVRLLNEMIVKGLRNENIPAVPLQPLAFSVCEDGRIKSMFVDQIALMLDHGLVPVLHGDVCMDTVRGSCILSGDQSLPYVAAALSAKRVGLGSAADGVLDSDGKVISTITPKTFDSVKKHIGGSAGTDVTGGMLGKVSEILELAEKTGIESCIFNANTPGNVADYLNGKTIGTRISRD